MFPVKSNQIEDLFTEIGKLYPKQLTLVNKTIKDQPLIYVNQKFEEFTGYSSIEVLGKNCRFLQKNLQSPIRKLRIKSSLQHYINNSIDCCVDLKNYKKDGTVFYNRLCLIHYGEEFCVGLQNQVDKISLKEVIPTPLEVLRPFSMAINEHFSSTVKADDEFYRKVASLLEDACDQLVRLS